MFFKCGYYQQRIESKAVYTSVADPEFSPSLHFMNKLMTLCSYSTASLIQKKRIAENLIEEQIAYHNNKRKRLENDMRTHAFKVKWLFYFFMALLLADIFSEAYHLISRDAHQFNLLSWLASSMLFLSLFIPALIARFEAKKYVSEWKKLISQSLYMAGFLNKISNSIKAAKEDKEMQAVLNTLNENMYIENLEWEMFMLTKNEIPQ